MKVNKLTIVIPDDVLQQTGVKGMKWGVRRGKVKITGKSPEEVSKKVKEFDERMKKAKDRNERKAIENEYGNTAKPVKPGLIKEHLNSLKRERDWNKTLDNIDNLSTKEINTLANRIQLENDFKRLSKKHKIGNKEDRQEYRNRDKMSDADLLNKVSRLRAKDNLVRNIHDASKEQREVGKRVVGTAAGVGLRYALTGTVSTKDIAKLAMMPSATNAGKLKKSAIDKILDKTDRTVLSRAK